MGKVALPLTGACHCGDLTYELTEAPLVVYACHCAICQRISGSAFAMSVIIHENGVNILTGDVGIIEWVAESGNVRRGNFCNKCGTRISHETEGGDMQVVRGGTLDDTGWLVPTAHIWTKSAQKWISFREDDLTFDAQPEDYMPLLIKFKSLDLFEV